MSSSNATNSSFETYSANQTTADLRFVQHLKIIIQILITKVSVELKNKTNQKTWSTFLLTLNHTLDRKQHNR